MEDVIGEFIPIAFFAMIAAIIIVPRYYKSLERRKLAETMRAAIEKGQPLPPEVVDALTKNDLRQPPAPRSDLRRGMIWLSVAVGLVLFSLVMGYAEPDHALHFIAIAAVPGCVGVAFLILAWLNRTKS